MAALLRVSVLPAPIYSGDEYAYYRLGTNINGIDEATQRDQALQRVDNYAYLRIVQRVSQLSDQPFQVMGIVQCFVWLFVLVAVWKVSGRLLADRHAWIPPSLAALAPFATYTSSMMPEIMLGACFWLICLAVLHFSRTHRWSLLALVLGIGIAPMLFIKIHALAFMLSALLFFAIQPWMLEAQGAGRLRAAGINVVIFGAAFLLSHKVSALVFSPADLPANEKGFYAGLFDAITARTLMTIAAESVRYLLLHLHVLYLFFVPALASIGILFWQAWRNQNHRPVVNPLSLFWAIALPCHLGMVSLFTAIVAIDSDFEANRLHERYYWFLLPALVMMTVQSWELFSEKAQRVLFGFALLNALVFIFHTATTFNLYPWDAADFFGLYRTIPGWQFGGTIPALTYVLYALILLAASAGLWRAIVAIRVWVLCMLVLASTSYLSVLAWQRDTMQLAQPLYQQARELDALSGSALFGVAGPERYGPMAYFLAGLKTPPYVGAFDGRTLTDAEIPEEVEVVVLFGSNEYQGSYVRKMTTALSTIYFLNTSEQ